MPTTFATVGVWSYGLAAAGFAVFLAVLAVGRRLPAQPRTLLAAVAASVAWALAGVAFAMGGGATWWIAQVLLDLLRIGLWLALLATFFGSSSTTGRASWSPFQGSRWPVWLGLVAAAAAAAISPPRLAVEGFQGGAAGSAGIVALLGVTIFGLALIEHLLRNAPEQVGWRLKPLLLALGSVFAFDLLVFSEAFLFRAIDPDLWAARGVVNLLVLPLVAVTIARSREWTPGVVVSRGVVFHSVALVGCGVYLLAMAAAGYYVRYFGGSWGKSVQTILLFCAALVLVVVVFSGTVRSRLRVFVGKHFFAYRYDYRQEWLRFTSRLSSPDPAQTLQQQCIRALADLVESPGGILWLRNGTGFIARRALEHARDGGERAVREPVCALPRRGRVDHRRHGVAYGARALRRPAATGVARRTRRRMARRPAQPFARVARLRRPREPARTDRRQLGGARPPEDREPAGRELSRAAARERGAARGAQVRRLQPDVGVRRPRSEEPRRAALADAQERRAPPRQAGVPAGHADDGRERRGADEPAAAAAPLGHDAGRQAGGRGTGAGREARPGGEVRRAAAVDRRHRRRRPCARSRGPARAGDRASRAERARCDAPGGDGRRERVPREQQGGDRSCRRRCRHDVRVRAQQAVPAVPVEQADRDGHRCVRERAVRAGSGRSDRRRQRAGARHADQGCCCPSARAEGEREAA